MTRADKIREMTDDELSVFLAWLNVDFVEQIFPMFKWKEPKTDVISGTSSDVLEWLHEEFVEDDV